MLTHHLHVLLELGNVLRGLLAPSLFQGLRWGQLAFWKMQHSLSAVLNHSFLQDHTPYHLSKQVPGQGKVSFFGVQDPAISSVPSSLDPELHTSWLLQPTLSPAFIPPILCLAGMELIFFIAACMWLCFGFVTKCWWHTNIFAVAKQC